MLHTEIAERISRDGFAEIPGFIAPEALATVRAAVDAGFSRPMVNGQMGYVKVEKYRYLFQTLSWAREIVDVYTDPRLLDVAEHYVGGRVHLSNYRIYRSHPDRFARMHWHVDNKEDFWDPATRKFVSVMRRDDLGLILIAYLSDVSKGGLQIIRGSHAWSASREQEVWNEEARRHAADIVTFNDRPAGTAIVYDYRCIHRAQPYWSGAPRTSLFGQYSPEHMPVGEPILLPTVYAGALEERARQVLNFGKVPTTLNWPIGLPVEVVPPVSYAAGMARLAIKKVRKWIGAFL